MNALQCSREGCDRPRWFPAWKPRGFRRCEEHQRTMYPGTVRE